MKTFVKGYFVLATCLCATVTPLRSETILQKEEKISFERCLIIIDKSAEQLGVTPKLKSIEDRLHIAEFKMTDGVLKITCNRETYELIVSTF